MIDGKTIVQVWFAVNRDGFLGLYLEEPKRDDTTGKWVSDKPFLNTVLYRQVKDMVDKSKFTWSMDPECFAIQLGDS